MKNEEYKTIINVEAERSVLGAILMDNAALYQAEQHLRPDDFFHEAHRLIYARMLLLDSERQPIDIISVVNVLGTELPSVGGAPYVSGLADGMPRVSNVAHYARIVKQKSEIRTLSHLGLAITKATQEADSPESVLELAEAGILDIRERDISSKGMMRIGDVVLEAQPTLKKIEDGEGVIIGTPTGYRDLDQKIAGWVSGEFVILAARPSDGKTAFALEAARRQAEMENPVAIWSLEMSRDALMLRLACQAGRVSGHLLRIGRLSKEEWGKLRDGLDLISRMPIWIDDTPAITAHRIRSTMRTMAQRHHIKLAIVDYLQLVRAKGENRTQEVTNISMSLKAAARDLGNISNGTLMALSQLSRLKHGQVPRLSDLRESGQIEADADTVIFIYNDPEAQITAGQAAPWTKVLDVQKQRNGPLGTVSFMFFPATMEFRPAANSDQHETETEINF